MLGKLFNSVGKRGEQPDATERPSGFLALYDREFAKPLRGRKDSFRIMFERLQARAGGLDRPLLKIGRAHV